VTLPAHAGLGAFRHVSAHAEAVAFLALAGLAVADVALAIQHERGIHVGGVPGLLGYIRPCGEEW
jgi:hypothetical protein